MAYRENGSAAVDFYALRNNAARPLEQPSHLPDAPKKPARAQRPKAKLHASPMLIISGIVAAFLLFLVIFNYMRLYEAQSLLSDLKEQQEELTEEQNRLQAKYESMINLEEVAARARGMGMREPLPAQVVYVEVASGDTTEVFSAPEQKGLIARVYDAFHDSLSDVVEYFS